MAKTIRKEAGDDLRPIRKSVKNFKGKSWRKSTKQRAIVESIKEYSND